MHLMLPGVRPSCISTVAIQWKELVFFKNLFFLIHERIRKCIGKCDDKMAVRKEKSRPEWFASGKKSLGIQGTA